MPHFIKEPASVRFWRFVTRSGDDDCWVWGGCKNQKGYGEFRDGDKRRILAHRFSWQEAGGSEPPAGLCVLHRCDNPTCVNPRHLFLGTRTDNNRDMRTKGRHSVGSRHPSAKLDEWQACGILAAYLMNLGESVTARRFGVSASTARDVTRGRTWRFLFEEATQ